MAENDKKDMETPKEETPVDKEAREATGGEAEAKEAAGQDTPEKAPREAPQSAPPKEAPKGGPRGGQRGGPRGGQRGGRGPARDRGGDAEEDEFVERVVKINRVSKVVKGGKNFSFSALVVAGNGKGEVGIGFGKSNEVSEAIKKGSADARKNFSMIKMTGSTIPHEIIGRFKATRVLLKPAGPGTGVIAGGAVRAMCDAAGIKDILTKSLGSRNAINVVKATMDGFRRLRVTRRG
jgi:small subunit ribosomal protein S5